MAAEQSTGRPRLCLCGCGRSLEGLYKTTQYARDCMNKRRTEHKRQRDAARGRSERERTVARAERKSLHPLAAAVWRSPYEHASHVHQPNPLCKTCFGLPWARTPGREQNDNSSAKVGDASFRCVECREPYEPEPPPERGSILRSSAGTTQQAAALYGHQPIFFKGSK